MQNDLDTARTKALPAPREAKSRRLVDYTQCRSDGTKARNATNVDSSDKATPLSLSKTENACLPSFRALDEYLSQVERLGNDEPQDEDKDPIHFFLKVLHKNQRPQSRRVSTLDTIGGRKIVTEKIVSSRRSMQEVRFSSPLRSEPVVSEQRRKSSAN